jgi:glycine/D-amino acid oxidase-like deaminating enzyme
MASLVDLKHGVTITPIEGRRVVVSGFADIVSAANGVHHASPQSVDSDRRTALLEVARGYLATSQVDIPSDANDKQSIVASTCLYTATPDDLPLLGTMSTGVFLNVGHGAQIFTNCCGSGEIISEMAMEYCRRKDDIIDTDNIVVSTSTPTLLDIPGVLGGVDLESFSPRRFCTLSMHP